MKFFLRKIKLFWEVYFIVIFFINIKNVLCTKPCDRALKILLVPEHQAECIDFSREEILGGKNLV